MEIPSAKGLFCLSKKKNVITFFLG
ncbi:hypothetical protein NC651_005486 [Populus alba x Populus x berolinensis]|nr:hypothetical protein NC651_005471 [Populus alba x Populus x berolinensis]KAJ6939060.1 hypothetical protein NC651_005486 [Populus alba x Populus x berolinensis]